MSKLPYHKRGHMATMRTLHGGFSCHFLILLQSSITHGAGPLLVTHREASAFGCAHQARLCDSETTLRSLPFFPALHTAPEYMLMEFSLKAGKTRRPIALNVNSTALSVPCNKWACRITRDGLPAGLRDTWYHSVSWAFGWCRRMGWVYGLPVQGHFAALR